MKQVRPIYGQDYAPGYSLFTYKNNSSLSKDIGWFQNKDEALEFGEKLKIKGLSHVISVKDEHTGYEAAEHGIRECELSKYFDDPEMLVICREPDGLWPVAAAEKLEYQKSLLGSPYDYAALGGFALSIISGFSKIIPYLKKLPIPFHLPGARVCSSYEADGFLHTERYRHIPLFQDYHVTRIHVNLLWNRFPYKPFRFEEHDK